MRKTRTMNNNSPCISSRPYGRSRRRECLRVTENQTPTRIGRIRHHPNKSNTDEHACFVDILLGPSFYINSHTSLQKTSPPGSYTQVRKAQTH